MEINGEKNTKKPIGVAIGNFDGVHFGHAFLLDTLLLYCRQKNLHAACYTFSEHPANVIYENSPVRLIMTNEQKAEYIKKRGEIEVIFGKFDKTVAAEEPEDFVKRVVVGELGASLVCIGENFTFGKNGCGKAETLCNLGKKYGFEVEVVPTLLIEGQRVSSTFLRQLVENGEMKKFARYAGHPYIIPGIIEHGREVGRTLGFPTANIRRDERFVLPKPGVYETVTNIGGKKYIGITNVGNNPTFNLHHIVVETHILDYEKDIYGQYIEVEFVEKMRDEVKFESINQLKMQIFADKQSIMSKHNILCI